MQTMVEAIKAAMLAVSGEGREQNTEQNGATEVTRHRRRSVFNWNAKGSYMEIKNLKGGYRTYS